MRLNASNLNDVNNRLMVINNDLYLTQQLKEICNEKHLRFMTETKHDHDANDTINGNLLWPKGTICVIGDSIIQGLDERRLGKNNKNVKVRCFPGSNIDDNDMFHYCKSMIKKYRI